MTVSSLSKFLIPATITAGAVFSVLAMPLVFCGSEPVNVQFQGETFDGPLKELATPYLGLAGLLSLGAGVAGLALTGWRHSAQQFSQVEQQLQDVQQQLREKEVQLQSSFLSDHHLDASGLRFFLDDETLLQPKLTAAISAKQNSEGTAQSPVHATAIMPLTIESMNFKVSSRVMPQMSVQAAVSPLSAAQAFLSFSRANVPALVQAPQADQLGELQSQLQQILSQIETLQGSLIETPQPALNSNTSPENLGTISQLKQRLQNLETQWVMQKAS